MMGRKPSHLCVNSVNSILCIHYSPNTVVFKLAFLNCESDQLYLFEEIH